MQGKRFQALLQGAIELTVPAGAQVFRQGDRADRYLLVTEGSVRVFARSDEGREIVLYRVGPGEMCTLTTACLLGRSDYRAEAVAETATVAQALPASRFHELISASPEFREFVFTSFSGRLNDIMQRFEELVLASVGRKLARCLTQQADADRVVHLTHEAIATEIGTAREVVSRHLKALEARGVVELGRGWIRIRDAAGLDATEESTAW